MERDKLEGMLIDYIDNRLNTVDRQHVEQELVRNAEAYKLYEELKEVMHVMDRSARLEPGDKLKTNFENLLKEEMASSRQAKTIFFRPAFYRAAAAVALLIIGGGIGFFISKKNDERMAKDQERLDKLEIEMAITKDMMSKLNNDQSASQRIQGVNVALSMAKADDEIVKALVKTMNEDQNSNVRLAALEALSKFIGDKQVRVALINSLTRQKDPIVQIQLIQLLVKMKEKGVVNDLQKIVDDEGTIQAVKDEAYTGIMKLS
jgi:HEAT repeat protein